MSKSNVIKNHEEVTYSVRTIFTKDCGMFKVEGTVWTYVSGDEDENLYEHDINDIELSFHINDKYCRYVGFKELYEKLYGEKSFEKFEQELEKEFTIQYFKTTPYRYE